MRCDSSAGVLVPKNMAPRQIRLTLKGPSGVFSMPLHATVVRRMRSVCVYCGSNVGADPAFAEATRELARLLVARGIRVVYGGAAVGLMGVLADTAMEAGGEVIGVLPQGLMDREIGHAGLTELRVVSSMHERKAQMAELADAFVALLGGIGTLEELIEIYTWS